MKVFVLLFAVLATSVYAKSVENVDIDWSTVKPIEMYPKFWDNKPAELRPSASFFEQKYRVGRIVNGYIATPHQFPYQVALLMFLPSIGGNALCGGSLLNNNFVLTAAHCIEGATDGTVILGAHDISNPNEPNQIRVRVQPQHLVMHEGWDPSIIRNDVAVIRLPNPVTFNTAIQPVSLPTSAELNDLFVGDSATVSGWGVFSDAEGRSSNVLRHVDNPIITHTACSIRFPTVVQASNICLSGAEGRGACSGDSGGPLTVQRRGESIQIGVVSFGLALGCERSWPSVFARTTFFWNWIRTNAEMA